LVVDDTPENLQLLTESLMAHGYEVRPVLSGEMGLHVASTTLPDLIILDVNMPGLNGYEVCKRLKADPLLAAVPVIFLSGRGDPLDKVRALELGAVDYVAKPFEVSEVEARIRTHLELARLRRELQRHNTQLEEIVAERTRELEEAKARLAVLDQAKSDFLQLISHEVRTPLNGIFGLSELLLDLCGDSPEAARYGELYQQSRQRMMALIDDALLLSEIGSGGDLGAHQSRSLAELLDEARVQAEPTALLRHVDIAPVPAESVMVVGVPEHLVRALQSLLETAVKFAAVGTTVRLAQEAAPAGVRLAIEADGQGIPPEVLPRFFQLLAIAKPLTRGGDLGLAPAVAERIVTLYGGTVTVENLSPPGVRFLVCLKTPAAAAPATGR